MNKHSASGNQSHPPKKFLLRWHAGKSAVIKSVVVVVDLEEAWRLRNRTYRVDYKRGIPSDVVYAVDSGRTKYHLAREIMDAPEGWKVLHRNCDVLDCRKENMLLVKEIPRGLRKYRKHPLDQPPES